jgi:predicted lipid carrier protein YhbT
MTRGRIAARPRRGSLGGDLLMLFSPPVNLLLGAALRRVARLDPDVFDRLGKFRRAAFLIAPVELPVAFRLEPTAGGGRVTVVRPDDAAPVAARISGPLEELMGLFDGSRDADSAFFSRSIDVRGDTDAVVALHNALEAAELTLADLLGAPAFARAPLERGVAFAMRDVLPRLRPRGA